MSSRNPESRRQKLISVLAAEATELVVSGEYDARGAVNAAMNTYKNDVLDQRTRLFGPVIQEVQRRIDQEKTIRTQQQNVLYRDAAKNARQQLEGFDGEDRPFESPMA